MIWIWETRAWTETHSATVHAWLSLQLLALIMSLYVAVFMKRRGR